MTSHYEKGIALYYLNRYDPALVEFGLARTEMPDDSRPVMMAAFCQYMLHQHKHGLKLAKEALAIDPNSVQNLQVFGLCLSHLMKEKLAKEALEKALSIDPEDASSHYFLAWHYSLHGDWRQSLAAIERAIEFDPDNAEYLAHRSKALTILGKKSEAKETTMQALKIDAENSSAFVQHGFALRLEGDIVGSMRAYREALRKDPTDIEARTGLLEALRSRFFLYRWIIGFQLALMRLPPRIRGIFSAMVYPFGKLIYVLWKEAPSNVRLLIGSIGAIYGLFLFAILCGPVFLDALTSADPELSQLLSRPQRRWAVLLSGSCVAGLASLVFGLSFGFVLLSAIGLTTLILFVVLSIWYRQEDW